MKIIRRDPSKGYIDNYLWVPKTMLNVEGVKNALTFVFPDTYSDDKVREVLLWKEAPHHLLVPRAFWKPKDVPYEVVDCRPKMFKKVKIVSRIKLDHRLVADGDKKKLISTGSSTQKRALDALLQAPGGILQLACGKGKTVVFLELAARMSVPALIIVDNTTLLEQWENEIRLHLDVKHIGLIKGSVCDWKHSIVLATYQTIASQADDFTEEMKRWFGLVGWDEGHHIAAPTFAKSADLFYGKRIALTATPKRDDGWNVIYDLHIGDVVYKDLSQDLKPRIVFKWTGLEIDENDPAADIRDRNKDVHMSKVTTYYAQWRQRLDMILGDIRGAVAGGRKKILVLSNSVAEIANLLALWIFGPGAFLYSHIPYPTLSDIGETIHPRKLSREKLGELRRFIESAEAQLNSQALNPVKEQHIQQLLADARFQLESHRVFTRLEGEMARRQTWYVKELCKFITDAGIMTFDVPAKTRISYVNKCQVIFAIMKYGKEGLDCSILDTVLVLEPFSSGNGLQQVLGRSTRIQPGKLQPTVMFYEDPIGQAIGMCQKLRKHLRQWPHDEGGPFDYELLGHPQTRHQWTNDQIPKVFGQ